MGNTEGDVCGQRGGGGYGKGGRKEHTKKLGYCRRDNEHPCLSQDVKLLAVSKARITVEQHGLSLFSV